MSVLRLLVGAIVGLGVTWLVFVVALAIFRPRGIDFAESKRLVPDVVRLVKGLATDPELPAGVRRRLAVLVVYLALPFDLVPDVIPVLGYADDVIVVALVLRSVVRRSGRAALDRHWAGSARGLAVVHALCGIG